MRQCSMGLLCGDVNGVSKCTSPEASSRLVDVTGIALADKLARATAVKTTRVYNWFDQQLLGMPCGGPGQRCSLELVCAGTAGNKVCRRPVGLGDACDDVYQVCATEQKCIKGVCANLVPEGSTCDEHLTVCEKGTFCNTEKACQLRFAEFSACVVGDDEGHCAEGLVCDRGTCRTAEGLGETSLCDPEKPEVACKDGLSCQWDFLTQQSTCTPLLVRIMCKFGCPHQWTCVGKFCYQPFYAYFLCASVVPGICQEPTACRKALYVGYTCQIPIPTF